jgi:hypothetical protein
MSMNLNYHPSDLSYYTTWWLISASSMSSSQNMKLSSLDEDPFIDRHRRKQVNIYKIFQNERTFFHLEITCKSNEIYLLFSDKIEENIVH